MSWSWRTIIFGQQFSQHNRSLLGIQMQKNFIIYLAYNTIHNFIQKRTKYLPVFSDETILINRLSIEMESVERSTIFLSEDLTQPPQPKQSIIRLVKWSFFSWPLFPDTIEISRDPQINSQRSIQMWNCSKFFAITNCTSKVSNWIEKSFISICLILYLLFRFFKLHKFWSLIASRRE